MYQQSLYSIVTPIKQTTITRLNRGKKWKYGYNDHIIEFMLGQNQFLANRLYNIGFSSYPEWDEHNGLYRPFGVTREVGPVREYFLGTGDSTDLNNAFDQVVMQGGIYYLMCHYHYHKLILQFFLTSELIEINKIQIKTSLISNLIN